MVKGRVLSLYMLFSESMTWVFFGDSDDLKNNFLMNQDFYSGL